MHVLVHQRKLESGIGGGEENQTEKGSSSEAAVQKSSRSKAEPDSAYRYGLGASGKI